MIASLPVFIVGASMIGVMALGLVAMAFAPEGATGAAKAGLYLVGFFGALLSIGGAWGPDAAGNAAVGLIVLAFLALMIS